MIIHSIISMEDIFYQPDYSKKEKSEDSKKQISNGLIKTSGIKEHAKTKNIFSTDPTAYLKYMI